MLSLNSTIEIDNTTVGPLSLKLAGPASFKFNLGTGVTVLNICSGSYSYEAWGCGALTIRVRLAAMRRTNSTAIEHR